MYQQNEGISENLPASFYIFWNAAADYFNSFQNRSTAEEKIAQLNLAKSNFNQAKSFCQSPENIAACNMQLALIIDKKIEIYAQAIIEKNQLSLDEWLKFISFNLKELSHLFEENQHLDAGETFATIHHNIGVIYFGMIDEFDSLDISITETLANQAKFHFERAKSFAQHEEVIEINQNMIDRVNFDVAALFKLDLNNEMNFYHFGKYYAFFTEALHAYRRNKNLCSNEDMLELTEFTLVTINDHYFALVRFHIPNLLTTAIPNLKDCLLLLSRTSGNKQDAMVWMEKYRLLESQNICPPATDIPSAQATSVQETLFPSLLRQNLFSSSSLSAHEEMLNQFSMNTQYLLEGSDYALFSNHTRK